MNMILGHYRWTALAALFVVAVASASDAPIGALTAEGKVSVGSESSTFTLQDQEYAYFSGDTVSTGKGATAVIHLNDGLDVSFVGSSTGRISSEGGAYTIALEEGHIVVDAAEGINYQITHGGKPVARDQALGARDEPFVASVATPGDVQFYMPAQLDETGGGEGLSGGEIATILVLLGGGAYVISDDDDDDGPSS